MSGGYCSKMANILLTPVLIRRFKALEEEVGGSIFDQKEPLGPNYGLYRIKFFLESFGHTADVLDLNLQRKPYEEIVRVVGQGDYDIIGSSTDHLNLENNLFLSHLVKREFPDIPFIYGGIQATFDPKTVAYGSKADLIAIGEGEYPILDVLDRIDLLKSQGKHPAVSIQHHFDDIKGLYLIPRDKMTRSPSEEEITDMITFTGFRPQLTKEQLVAIEQLFDFGQVPYEEYWQKMGLYHGHKSRMVNFIATNYCPGGCSFCSSTNFLAQAQGKKGAKMHSTSADMIFETIYGKKGIIQSIPGVSKIGWQDDNAIYGHGPQKRMQEFCQRVIDEIPLEERVNILCLSRINNVDLELLKLMNRAGITQIGYGVENFSTAGHKGLNKNINQKQVWTTLAYTFLAGQQTQEERSSLVDGRQYEHIDPLKPWVNVIIGTPHIDIDGIMTNIAAFDQVWSRGGKVACYPFILGLAGSRFAQAQPYCSDMQIGKYEIGDTGISIEKGDRLKIYDTSAEDLILGAVQRSKDVGHKIYEMTGHKALPSEVVAAGYTIALLEEAKERGIDLERFRTSYAKAARKDPFDVQKHYDLVKNMLGK